VVPKKSASRRRACGRVGGPDLPPEKVIAANDGPRHGPHALELTGGPGSDDLFGERWILRAVSAGEDGSKVFRPGGVSYLRVPTTKPRETAAFYAAVFGWSIGGRPDSPSFEDGTGHVIGHFVDDLPVAGDAGVRPYIYVESVDETLGKVTAYGGGVVDAPYPEGDLWVATFRDAAGNVLGVWQRGARRR
jgi:predicted enzyme related to lactoylglutathione lyase